MSFRLVILALLCWAIAQAAPARVAVILTDTKMDDKGAVAVALEKRDAQKPEKKQYDGVMLVFTGVEDRGRVAQGMNQFLLRAEKHVPAFSADWKSRLRWFKTRDNIMGDVKSHEQWYKDLQPYEPLPVATGSSLAAAIAHVDPKASVDIFQIAPCADKDVWDFIDAIPNINVYHLFFGYNSRQGSFELVKDDQDKEELAERQSKFHATLQDHLQAKHPHARVIFTQNVPTFDNAKAGSQDLDWCRQYFPKEDIDMALYDHFWSKRVREANAYADPDLQIEIPDDRDEFLRQVVEARLKPTALRTKILQVVKSALANGELTDLTDKTCTHAGLPSLPIGGYPRCCFPSLTQRVVCCSAISSRRYLAPRVHWQASPDLGAGRRKPYDSRHGVFGP